MIAANLVSFGVSPSALGVVAVALSALLAWLLFRRSRAAWVVAIVGSGADIVMFAVSADSAALAGVSAIVLACLLAPSSVRFIWGESSERSVQKMPFRSSLEAARGAGYAVLARFAGWSVQQNNERRTFGLLAWRLGVSAVLLLIPLTSSYRWDRTSNSGVVHGLASAMWTLWALVVVSFVIVLGLLMFQHVNVSARANRS
jgi:hypothetical protein